MKKLGKYSFGTGDRFSHQGEAQLAALLKAQRELGVTITPVWNKSNREHNFIHSEPTDTRREADAAVKALNYAGPYFVDADHINLNTVDRYIKPCDFLHWMSPITLENPLHPLKSRRLSSGSKGSWPP